MGGATSSHSPRARGPREGVWVGAERPLLWSLGQILFPLRASAYPCPSLNRAVIWKVFKGLSRDTVSDGVLGTFEVAWYREYLGSPRGSPFLVECMTLFSAQKGSERWSYLSGVTQLISGIGKQGAGSF